MHKPRHTGDRIGHDAAFWFARLRADRVGPSERRRFARWASGGEKHLAAYADLEELWDETGEMAADAEILAMRKEALQLGRAGPSGQWRKFAAVAAVVLAFVAAGLIFAGPLNWTGEPVSVAQAEIYRTDVGERSTVILDDGSVVELNTDTVLQASFSPSERDVRLLKGQALFQVAHDTSRPFVVNAAGQRVTAVGTMFDVRIDGASMRVTLLEGVVKVEHAGDGARPPRGSVRKLKAGEQLVAVADQPFEVTHVDPVQSVSWRTGEVIFSDERLGGVIAEINRYSRQKVVLADPSLAELKISGVFRAGSTGNFVRALEGAFPIESERDVEDRIILKWDSRRPA